jgi:hypothetical protein
LRQNLMACQEMDSLYIRQIQGNKMRLNLADLKTH